MRRNIAERLPLTLREQEAELEAAANARALSRPTKQPASLKDVRCIRVERPAVLKEESRSQPCTGFAPLPRYACHAATGHGCTPETNGLLMTACSPSSSPWRTVGTSR